MLSAPLDHASPGGESIDVHIARRPAKTTAKRQLWLLSGGPGQGGNIWHGVVSLLAERMPDTDVMVIDHRGTGHSTRLTCPQQDTPQSSGGYVLDPDGAPACLAYLADTGVLPKLAWFTSSQAAQDLKLAIRRTRAPGQEVHVWGGSYGTHWAHRLLQHAPDELSGIVFDGFFTPGVDWFIDYDHGIEEVGIAFAAGCAKDPVCASKMGPDPMARAQAILAGLEKKPCGIFGRSAARTYASVFLDSLSTRRLVFPFLHRLERCETADKQRLTHVVQALKGTSEGDTAYLGSGILQLNIVLSELWAPKGKPAPTAAELAAKADAQTFLAGSSYAASVAGVRDIWPLPPDDAATLPLPVKTATPLLWLAGEQDSRTPLSQAKQITGLYPDKLFVSLPFAAHTPSFASPRKSDPKKSCGLDLLLSFVTSGGAPDTSCIGDLQPALYAAPTAESATYWWGTDDDWGDGTPAPPSPVPYAPVLEPRSPAAVRALATVKLGGAAVEQPSK